jgi:hypothetical protein
MSFKEALRHCKTRRPQICPNLGFELQLKAYGKRRGSEIKLVPSVSVGEVGVRQRRNNSFYGSGGDKVTGNKDGGGVGTTRLSNVEIRSDGPLGKKR